MQTLCEKADNKIRTFSVQSLPKLCRSCLCEVHRDYFSLGGFYLERKVVDIYKNVTSIEISTEDNMPKKLCATCYDHIIKFDLFKKKVLESEKLLTKYVNTIVEDVFVENNICKSELSSLNDDDDDCWDFDQGDGPNEWDLYQKSDSEDEIPLLERLKKYSDGSEQKYTNKTRSKEGAGYNRSELEENCKNTITDKPEKIPKIMVQKKRVRKKKDINEKGKHERRKEPCTECGKVLFSYKMENHMRTHTKEKPYECEKCGARFSEKSNLNRHLKIHGNERPYKCEKCGKGFLRPSSRAIHEVTAHNTERNVLCPICAKGFKHQYFLKKHMTNIHNKTAEKVKVEGPGYPCPICGNLYRTKSSLTVHKMKHEQPRAFLCNICGNGYSTKAVLENHQKVHTGEKNFSCDICNKRFRFITTLKTHVLVHSGEKPLSCPLCNKQFRQHSHLNTHIKGQHSTNRPYQCTYCLKTFKHSCNLTVHIRIHTGETPYICDICQKGFYCSSSMKKHRKGHYDKNNLSATWEKMEEDLKLENTY